MFGVLDRRSQPRLMSIFQSIHDAAQALKSNMNAGFQCAGCGEWNEAPVDESAGRKQSYVQDCQVCCRPNVLQVSYDPGAQRFFITAELE
jgi:hypothetical protein